MLSLLNTLDGPPQAGQGSNGQYVYWITMAFPSEETVAEHGMKLQLILTEKALGR